MRAVVVSDLHLGTNGGSDLVRSPGAARDALLERVRGADHLILLGDLLELREAPIADVMSRSEPFIRALGEAAGHARVTIVPGNHDHRLAAPLIEERRLEGGGGSFPIDRSAAPPPT